MPDGVVSSFTNSPDNIVSQLERRIIDSGQSIDEHAMIDGVFVPALTVMHPCIFSCHTVSKALTQFWTGDGASLRGVFCICRSCANKLAAANLPNDIQYILLVDQKRGFDAGRERGVNAAINFGHTLRRAQAARRAAQEAPKERVGATVLLRRAATLTASMDDLLND